MVRIGAGPTRWNPRRATAIPGEGTLTRGYPPNGQWTACLSPVLPKNDRWSPGHRCPLLPRSSGVSPQNRASAAVKSPDCEKDGFLDSINGICYTLCERSQEWSSLNIRSANSREPVHSRLAGRDFQCQWLALISWSSPGAEVVVIEKGSTEAGVCWVCESPRTSCHCHPRPLPR